MKTKMVVLGAGRWGTHLVRNFWQHPDAELVAVVDPYLERLIALKNRLNFNSNVVLATDWESLRGTLEIDAVVIATPAVTHYSLIQDALARGYHILAEKPLTLTARESLELCRLAQQQQRQLMVDHTYLFHPAVTRGKEVLESGCLGELHYGYAARTNLGPVRQDVDAVWDLAIHDIAIFNNWLGEFPVEVQAIGKVWLQKGEGKEDRGERDEYYPLPAQGLADFVRVTLTYPSGFLAEIHLCWSNPDKQRRLGVVGSRGTLIFDEMQSETPLTIQHGYFQQEGEFFNPAGIRCEVIEIEKKEPLGVVCDRFLASVKSNEPSTVSSGWVGTQLVQILNCLSQSLAEGGKLIHIPSLSCN